MSSRADEVPFELPDGWVGCRLCDICNLVGGTTPKKEMLTKTGTPYFKVAEMNLPGNEKYLRNTSVYVSTNARIRRFPANTIVFPKNGGALLTNKKRILVQEAICDLNTGGLILHDTKMLNYVFYWLSSIDLGDYLSGGVIPTINSNRFRATPILLPPLAEQKRIVARIEELFKIADSLGEAADGLEATAKRLDKKIFDLAIRGKLVPQDPTDEPASELLKRIAATSHKSPCKKSAERDSSNAKTRSLASEDTPFVLPDGWAWCKISDVFSVERGGSPRPIKNYLTNDANGINWIKIADASASGKYITSVREKIRPQGLKKTRRVFAGDLLLTNSMSFGHPYILQVDGCIHDGWLVLHALDSELDKEFFYHLLSSRFVYASFSITASGGVVQNLNADKVSDTTIPLPPLTEQKRIVAKIEELRKVTKMLTM